MVSVKQAVVSLLAQLPDDCSIEDIQYHLYVIEKIHHGLEAAQTEGTIPQEEANEALLFYIQTSNLLSEPASSTNISSPN